MTAYRVNDLTAMLNASERYLDVIAHVNAALNALAAVEAEHDLDTRHDGAHRMLADARRQILADRSALVDTLLAVARLDPQWDDAAALRQATEAPQ